MHASSSLLSFLAVFLLVFSTGCEQVDELIAGLGSAPTVSYSSTSIAAEFYTPGTSPTPSIDWNGDQGTIALGTTVEGLTINSTTGKLSWTKLLPPGTHEVDVIVSNSEGQVVVPVTILNPLSGTFAGNYDGSSYFALQVMKNGDLVVLANSSSTPDRGEGNWSMEGDTFSGYYEYITASDDYSLIGTLEQTNSGVVISGNYYPGVYEDGDSPYGTFEVTLQ